MPQRSAAIIIKDGKILLMRRRKNTQEYFTIPGGTIEAGETPQLAAIREVMEETGLSVEIDWLLFEFDGISGREYFFVTKNISGEEKLGGPEARINCQENFYELAWIELNEVSKLKLFPPEIKAIILETAF